VRADACVAGHGAAVGGKLPVRSGAWPAQILRSSARRNPRPTFGTLNETAYSMSATGTAAVEVGSWFADLYLIPLSPATGQPTGIVRRLTQDGRHKVVLGTLHGDPDFAVFDTTTVMSYYALDIESGKQSGKQTLVNTAECCYMF